MPMFDDGAYVVHPVPYLTWIRAANLFDSLALWIHWQLGNSPATPTATAVPVRDHCIAKKRPDDVRKLTQETGRNSAG
jgi:hypothetical protein